MTKRKRNLGVPTVELFSGAGLLSHSFALAGATSLLAVEAEPRARASFMENVGTLRIESDVRDVVTGVRADLLIGGPPCQGFSSLGKRDALDERNSLSLLMVEWAKVVDPKVVVIENVPQFLESRQFKLVRARLGRLGFESATWILDAVDYGAPQRRRRAFAVFSRIGLPETPAPTAKAYVTVRQAFDGLPSRLTPRMQHIAPVPGELALARFKLIPRGGDKRDLLDRAPALCPPSWNKIPNQATDVWGRMLEDEPANTIRCSFQNASKGRYIHPDLHRVISLREGARLQGVPDEWKFHGDPKAIATQIGNGVPIPLGKAVAGAVLRLF